MITMLDCSELNTEISDAGIETIESDDCKKSIQKMTEIPMVC